MRTNLDAPGVEAQVVWVGNGRGYRGGGSDHSGVIGAQLGRRYHELQVASFALSSQNAAQRGVSGHAARDDEPGGVVKVRRPQQLTRERLDDCRLVARRKVRQLFLEAPFVQRFELIE